jgi:hypothetical protein
MNRAQHRTDTGKLYSYRWGEFEEWAFSVERMDKADAEQINTWWRNRVMLTISFASNSESYAIDGRIGGDTTPMFATYYGYINLMRGKMSFEALSEQPPVVIIQPISQTKAIGDTVIFTTGAKGSRPMHYQWYHGRKVEE